MLNKTEGTIFENRFGEGVMSHRAANPSKPILTTTLGAIDSLLQQVGLLTIASSTLMPIHAQFCPHASSCRQKLHSQCFRRHQDLCEVISFSYY